MTRQLTLPLRIKTAAGFIDTPAHRLAIQALANTSWQMAYLFGPPASGKSHLAHQWATQNGGAWVFDISQLESHNPTEIIDIYPMVVIENAIEAVGEKDDLLLHWMNAVLNGSGRLLLTDRLPPAQWPKGLPDLISRLRLCVFIEIDDPDDETLALLLKHYFDMRQLRVSDRVQSSILRRIERSYLSVAKITAELDRLGLEQGAPITLAMAQDILSG
ncbi:MAG: hypothetical protein AAF442_04620 [Pseudomonadota bacterium]